MSPRELVMHFKLCALPGNDDGMTNLFLCMGACAVDKDGKRIWNDPADILDEELCTGEGLLNLVKPVQEANPKILGAEPKN